MTVMYSGAGLAIDADEREKTEVLPVLIRRVHESFQNSRNCMMLKTIFRSAVQLTTFPAKDPTAQPLKDVTAGAMFEESHVLTLQHPGSRFLAFPNSVVEPLYGPKLGCSGTHLAQSDLLYQKDRANLVI